MSRLEYNKLLLDILKEYFEQNPEIRFSQALSNLDYVKQSESLTSLNPFWIDEYYLESKDLLTRVSEVIAKMENK